MIRWLGRIFAVFCIVIAILWGQLRVRQESQGKWMVYLWHWNTGQWMGQVFSERNGVRKSNGLGFDVIRIYPASKTAKQDFVDTDASGTDSRAGFAWWWVRQSDPTTKLVLFRTYGFSLPAWFIMIALLVFPASWGVWEWRSRRVRRLARDGKCANCGYDLRAHGPSDKCPECGVCSSKALRA